ncbi:MAG: hypothetical protein ACRCZP_15475, partial [Phycicoccus sp.]
PPLLGTEGEVMYRLRQRVAEGDPRLGLRDWGLAVTLDDFLQLPAHERRAFLRNRDNWVATLPALGLGRVTEEGVEDLLKEFARDADAAREVLGLWPVQRRAGEGGWDVIPEEPWQARGGANARPDGPVAFGLAASWPDATFGALGVAGWADDELLVQVPVRKDASVDYRPGTAWMVARAVDLQERHPDAVFVLDKRGPAGHLLKPLEDAGVDVLTPDMGDVARAFGTFVAAVTGDAPTLRHYDQTELDDAVKTAGTRPLGDARTWARQGEGDISPLEAVTLAVLGANERTAEPWAEWG